MSNNSDKFTRVELTSALLQIWIRGQVIGLGCVQHWCSQIMTRKWLLSKEIGRIYWPLLRRITRILMLMHWMNGLWQGISLGLVAKTQMATNSILRSSATSQWLVWTKPLLAPSLAASRQMSRSTSFCSRVTFMGHRNGLLESITSK